MQQPDPNKFIYNQKLNTAFLDELFEGDTIYAETIFEDFLKDMPDYWTHVESAYKRKDLPELGSSIHKCKTLFGYVGFTDLQEFCQQFENNCSRITETELEGDYKTLAMKKEEARLIIESEYYRLKSFNEHN
jgi:HPt (histidine-containing phosphotransfer) domain-containing protein